MRAYFRSGRLQPMMSSAAALIAFIAATFFQTPASAAREKLVALINATIIDGNGGAPIEEGAILVEGERIKAVGANIEIPQGADIIDAAGRTAMPGLANMHVHLFWGGGDDFLGYQQRLNAFLYAGVTTVLDTGDVLPFVRQMREAIEANKIAGPSIYYAGPLIDSVDPQWPAISRSMASEAQAPGIVKHLKDNGASAIKAYAKLSRSQIRALVLAGEKQGLPVFLDAWARNGEKYYITAGTRAFAHTPSQVSSETLQLMKEGGMYVITTRSVGGPVKHALLRQSAFMESALIKNTTPSWRWEKLRKDIARARTDADYASKGFNPSFHAMMQRNLKDIFDAGIPLVAGTDDALFAGDDLHYELELLVDAGLTPLEAITTATKNAARLMGDEKEWGTLEQGKRADILLIDGRPDQNISDTRNIEMLMKKGNIIDRDKLVFDEKTVSGIRPIGFGYEDSDD